MRTIFFKLIFGLNETHNTYYKSLLGAYKAQHSEPFVVSLVIMNTWLTWEVEFFSNRPYMKLFHKETSYSKH